MTVDYNQIAERLQVISSVLELSNGEIPAIGNDEEIVKFAKRHGQSLDWILFGNARVMIARCAFDGRPGAQCVSSSASKA